MHLVRMCAFNARKTENEIVLPCLHNQRKKACQPEKNSLYCDYVKRTQQINVHLKYNLLRKENDTSSQKAVYISNKIKLESRKLNMNKFHKKSSRKNSNYNNYKKENNTMSNNNYENAMGQVMAGQEAAQQNLVGIVRNAFDFAGFNTDFLNNPRFAGLAAEAQDIVGFLEKMEQFGGAQLVEQLNNNASGFFDMFLTMDDKAIEYINSEPELNRACLFLNVLTFVGAFNYVERAELLNFLLTTTVTCNDTEQCMTAARAWTLYIGLLIPQMAA